MASVGGTWREQRWRRRGLSSGWLADVSVPALEALGDPWVWGLGLVAVVAGAALTQSSLTQVVILVAIAPILIAVALRSPRLLIAALATWLVAVGLARRLLLGLGSRALLGDPLLLVEPAVLLLLCLVAVRQEGFRQRSSLTKGVLALCVLALVEAFNPLQGGLTVGIGGLLFVLIPMLAFWVGRALCDDATMRRLLLLLAALAVPAAMYGLLQTYVGFPTWDVRWLQSLAAKGSYLALQVGGVIRAFSSFSSSAEYVRFLAVGLAVWFAWGLRRGRIGVAFPVLVLLGVAIFLDSSRGIVLLCAVGLGVMLAARARVRTRSAALWGLLALAGVFLAAGHLAPTQSGGSGPTAPLVQHEIAGLSQPFNSQSSTLGIHLGEVISGLKATLSNPLGHGTGTITIAAAKFGGVSQGTETDPSNAGVALGLPGLVAYLVVVVVGLSAAYRLAAGRRDWVSIAVLGLLVVTFLQWLDGEQYAVAWLPWLALGWVDKRAGRGEEAQASDLVALGTGQ